MSRMVRGRGLIVVALLGGVMLSGCSDSPSGPLKVRDWEIRVHDPWNVTFSFTVQNEWQRDVRFVSSHFSPEQFDPDPAGGMRLGGGGTVPEEHYPGRVRGRPALFNDTESLEPGESRRFSLRAYYPPKDNDVGPDDTYNAIVTLKYEAVTKRWTTSHSSPCLKRDGMPGEAPAWACSQVYEGASPID